LPRKKKYRKSGIKGDTRRSSITTLVGEKEESQQGPGMPPWAQRLKNHESVLGTLKGLSNDKWGKDKVTFYNACALKKLCQARS